MRLTTLLLAASVSASAASSVLAADLGPYRPAPPSVADYAPPPFSWTGLYMGANLGYGWGGGDRVGVTDTGVFQGNAGTLNTDGVFGGAQFGYNYQAGRFVMGFEADIQASDTNDSLIGTAGPYSVAASSNINYFGTVRGRLGVTAGPALLYVTGGWAWADVDYKLSTFDGVTLTTLTDNSFKSGYALGGGVEYALGRNWTAKMEYQYLDFGKTTLAGAGISTKESLDVHTVRMGVNYKF